MRSFVKLSVILSILFFAIDSYSQSLWKNPDAESSQLELQSAPVEAGGVISDNNEIDIELLDKELQNHAIKQQQKKAPPVRFDKSRATQQYLQNPADEKPGAVISSEELSGNNAPTTPNLEIATFAGGCFWCMEQPFDDIKGVISTTSGYTGGDTKNPTYEEVSTGKSGHVEAVQVAFDSNKIPYEELLKIYWKNVDPTNAKGQFCDIGPQYKPMIFYNSEAQKNAVYESLQRLPELGANFNQSIAVAVVPAKTFYAAEEYHQDYYKKNPLLYNVYKQRCGREKVLNQLWKKKL